MTIPAAIFPMAVPVVWAPMRGWPAAFVPKVWLGLREWTKDGPSSAPASLVGDPLGLVYEWRGPRLVCVNCPNAER